MSLTACEKEIFNRILKEELVPATGCTEPVAIAYAAAAAKKALGCEPEVCEAELSGNIIKNARCVAVPNTGGLKGIEAAVAAGVVAGRAELALDVLSAATGRMPFPVTMPATSAPCSLIVASLMVAFLLLILFRRCGPPALDRQAPR